MCQRVFKMPEGRGGSCPPRCHNPQASKHLMLEIL